MNTDTCTYIHKGKKNLKNKKASAAMFAFIYKTMILWTQPLSCPNAARVRASWEKWWQQVLGTQRHAELHRNSHSPMMQCELGRETDNRRMRHYASGAVPKTGLGLQTTVLVSHLISDSQSQTALFDFSSLILSLTKRLRIFFLKDTLLKKLLLLHCCRSKLE